MPVVVPTYGQVAMRSRTNALTPSFTYAEATLTQKVTDWIGGHVRALESIDGVSQRHGLAQGAA